MEQKKHTINIYALLIFLAGSLWGAMGLFVHTLNDKGCSSLDIVALRGILTAAMMFIVLLIKDKHSLKIKLKDIWIFVGTGIFSVIFFNYCYFKSIMEISMSAAAVLLYTAPAFVMLISAPLFSEKITTTKLISLACALVGCFFVSGILESGVDINSVGILSGLGAGFGYALYSIFGRFAINRGYSSLTITFYTFLFSGIGSFALTDVPHALTIALSNMETGIFSMLFVIISTVLPYLLYTKGLSGTENGQASIIASIEPVSATILGFIFFSETPSLFGFIGMILVITGIVISNINIQKTKRRS